MTPGTQLGSYEILSPLGKGGMGEVWRARDQKLGREVAIKTLPEEFAQDEERLVRFEREAKLLASLNRPNIATIHGLEEDNGTRFLVLELVEGDTLAERLKHGAVPVEESLTLALQIAEALEAAHEKGVIHRDLKPANIKVTPDGKIKVLDFGLAKAFAGDGTKADAANSPTLSMQATQQGMILGTAAYMSPEQASAETVDHRADIWAFGVVLFEMLTGCQVFTGKTASHIMGAVLERTPEWDSLPPNLHPVVRELLERCLDKDAKNRRQAMGDVRFDLQKVVADPAGVIVQPVAEVAQAAPQSKLPWAAAVVVGMLVTGVAVWFLKPESRPVVRFDHELAEGLQFRGTEFLALTVSPDGRQVVYDTTEGLYLLSVGDFDAQLIPGTESSRHVPTFSPDGEWIAYAGPDQLQRVSVNGGSPVVLTDVESFVAGMSWDQDETIVYSEAGTLLQVPADGGAPEPISMSGEGFFPQILPGGHAVLFQDQQQVVVQSLDAEERQILFPGYRPRYLPTGHIVYVVGGSLYAQAFDLENLEVLGSQAHS